MKILTFREIIQINYIAVLPATRGERRKNMTCRENCIHYAVCYKKPDHFDDLEVNGGCSDFQDKGEMEITREFILDNGLEFELFSYYERKRKSVQGFLGEEREMNCKDCLHYNVCLLGAPVYGLTGTCLNFNNKSEWVHLPCKKGDVLERNGERCEVDHWNVIATTFAEGEKLRLFNVEDAEKALEDMRKEDEGK